MNDLYNNEKKLSVNIGDFFNKLKVMLNYSFIKILQNFTKFFFIFFLAIIFKKLINNKRLNLLIFK